MTRVLTHNQARSFYDWFGAKQDWQRIYEDPAVDDLVAHGRFENARAIVELGCGTGRLAARLLEQSRAATYLGLDVSGNMARLASDRLRPFADRALVRNVSGEPSVSVGDRGCDRFVAAYVLDLLSEADIRGIVAEAHRTLAADGLFCVVSLTFGQTRASRLLCRAWESVHSASPALVGGCRPLRLVDWISEGWRVEHHSTICTLGLCSEVVIAAPN